MALKRTNITLGTAGHIDHGKTALIKCLTGCETDRLKAEKERGMSIELGFAPCTISDLQIGIVDVPGHENFIKTMVAGATGIDGVIFVIAADDGIMPQTREHLDILTLLGIKHGIVALTKIDCVTDDTISSMKTQVKTFLQNTFLKDAPIVALSSVTGQGFDSFLEALKQLVNEIQPRSTDGVFRLPIERTFSIKGYGTVVTGIPVAGSANLTDEVTLLPHGLKGRIRAIQVYKTDSDMVLSGQCAALNIPQWDYKNIKRGDVVTITGYFQPESWYLCSLHLLAAETSNFKNASNVKFHTGTSEIGATVYLMQSESLAPAHNCLIQVRLDEPLVAGPGDRFIIRTLTPPRTIAGGYIVEAIPRRLKRNRPEVLKDAKNRAQAVKKHSTFAEYCIKTAPDFAADSELLAHRMKLLPKTVKSLLDDLLEQKNIIKLTSRDYIHLDTMKHLENQLINIVQDFHKKSPHEPGIIPQKLLELSSTKKNVFDYILKNLLSDGRLVERKKCLASPKHRELFDDQTQKLLKSVEPLFIENLFAPPDSKTITAALNIDSDKTDQAIKILIQQQRLVRIEKDLVFHHTAVEKAQQLLTDYINEHGNLESVKFKYLLDTSRKFAIPLLDYFDRIGLTRREGYTRYLKK